MKSTRVAHAIDQHFRRVRVALDEVISRDGYATVHSLAEVLGLDGAAVGALALPLQQHEERGDVVRFRLPSGVQAWGLAPAEGSANVD